MTNFAKSICVTLAIGLYAVACDPKPPAGEGATGPTAATSSSAPSASPATSASAPSSASCKDLEKIARADVLKRIDESRACTQDSECVQIGVSARCFDICTRAIAASQKPAVESALADANTKCKDYVAAGCKLSVPPCMPPPDPKCREGKCTL